MSPMDRSEGESALKRKARKDRLSPMDRSDGESALEREARKDSQ